jgi:hypothetical protein
MFAIIWGIGSMYLGLKFAPKKRWEIMQTGLTNR